MRLFGLFLLALGVMCMTAAVALGLPFTGVYLLGFVGTGFREGGSELAVFLPATAVTAGVGYGLIQAGRALRPRTPPPDSDLPA